MNTSNLLTNNYLSDNEPWHKHKLSEQEANEYHERLLMQGNIITIIKDNELKGYLEIWKINYEQLGRIMCGLPVYALEENITDGNIAFVNNGWIDHGEYIYKNLLFQMKERFSDCEYVARRRFKYNENFKVYPMGQLGA